MIQTSQYSKLNKDTCHTNTFANLNCWLVKLKSQSKRQIQILNFKRNLSTFLRSWCPMKDVGLGCFSPSFIMKYKPTFFPLYCLFCQNGKTL